MCKEAGMNIPDTVIDKAYRIGNTNVDKKPKKLQEYHSAFHSFLSQGYGPSGQKIRVVLIHTFMKMIMANNFSLQ